MTVSTWLKKTALFFLLVPGILLICGCIFDRSYRSVDDLKTIRDYSDSDRYRKTVGVMALSNATIFSSVQVTEPFITAFISSIKSTAGDADLLVPVETDVPSFLLDPPRLQNGELDVFPLCEMARQKGMNAVVTPILMDIRVRKEISGFWFFKDVAHSLQIQTAAAIYDSITGTRLALKILTDDVDIKESQAETIRNGREAQVDDLVKIAEKMGAQLGHKMGGAIKKILWQTSIVAIEDNACIIVAGSKVGVKPGDRFAVLDGRAVMTGLNGQHFIVPGPKIGEMTIDRVESKKAFGIPESGEMPPVGSIVVVGG